MSIHARHVIRLPEHPGLADCSSPASKREIVVERDGPEMMLELSTMCRGLRVVITPEKMRELRDSITVLLAEESVVKGTAKVAAKATGAAR